MDGNTLVFQRPRETDVRETLSIPLEVRTCYEGLG